MVDVLARAETNLPGSHEVLADVRTDSGADRCQPSSEACCPYDSCRYLDIGLYRDIGHYAGGELVQCNHYELAQLSIADAVFSQVTSQCSFLAQSFEYANRMNNVGEPLGRTKNLYGRSVRQRSVRPSVSPTLLYRRRWPGHTCSSMIVFLVLLY